MLKDRILQGNWQALLRMLPFNWRELAKTTEALKRRPKNFKDEETIMRLFFLHFGNGYSLRETITRARLSELANVTDVALLKRLRCSEGWLKALCIGLLRERGTQLDQTIKTSSVSLRIVDGTIVKEPGQTGSQWRIHYSLKLPELQCDYFKLVSAKGVGTGETFKQFPVKKGDCIVGDRAYSTTQGINYLHEQGAYSLVRVNSAALNFYLDNESRFDVLAATNESLKNPLQCKEWHVKIKTDDSKLLDGRLCVVRKGMAAEEDAIRKIVKEARKRQRIVKPETLEYARYIVIFTTLPKEDFSLETVLEWYQVRWQIELAFKRLKSLIHLGHLPKYDEQSSRAWLYGKLLIGLMVEKLMSYSGSISPCGYHL